MGTIKDRKIKDLTEADEIKKRWEECTEELYKISHNDWDSDDAWVTHVKPEYWSMKLSGPQEASLQTMLGEVMEFQLRYLKLQKNEAVKVLENVTFHSNQTKKAIPKIIQTIMQLLSFHLLAR